MARLIESDFEHDKNGLRLNFPDLSLANYFHNLDLLWDKQVTNEDKGYEWLGMYGLGRKATDIMRPNVDEYQLYHLDKSDWVKPLSDAPRCYRIIADCNFKIYDISSNSFRDVKKGQRGGYMSELSHIGVYVDEKTNAYCPAGWVFDDAVLIDSSIDLELDGKFLTDYETKGCFKFGSVVLSGNSLAVGSILSSEAQMRALPSEDEFKDIDLKGTAVVENSLAVSSYVKDSNLRDVATVLHTQLLDSSVTQGSAVVNCIVLSNFHDVLLSNESLFYDVRCEDDKTGELRTFSAETNIFDNVSMMGVPLEKMDMSVFMATDKMFIMRDSCTIGTHYRGVESKREYEQAELEMTGETYEDMLEAKENLLNLFDERFVKIPEPGMEKSQVKKKDLEQELQRAMENSLNEEQTPRHIRHLPNFPSSDREYEDELDGLNF